LASETPPRALPYSTLPHLQKCFRAGIAPPISNTAAEVGGDLWRIGYGYYLPARRGLRGHADRALSASKTHHETSIWRSPPRSHIPGAPRARQRAHPKTRAVRKLPPAGRRRPRAKAFLRGQLHRASSHTAPLLTCRLPTLPPPSPANGGGRGGCQGRRLSSIPAQSGSTPSAAARPRAAAGCAISSVARAPISPRWPTLGCRCRPALPVPP